MPRAGRRPARIETVNSLCSTGLLVVDEDYREFGFSGGLAAVALGAGVQLGYAPVYLDAMVPYARTSED